MTLIPLTVVVPLLAAALLGMLRALVSRILSDVLAIAAATATTALFAILIFVSAKQGEMVYWFGHWTPHHGIALGIAFVVDPFSATVGALAGLLTTTSFCFAWRYFESLGTLFPTLMLVFLAAMAGYCLSGDLFTLFVFFELMSTAAYALTGYKIEADSLEGGLTFAIVNSLGALLFLWGLALLYGKFGALNLAQLGAALADAGPPTGLTIAALALITTGFLVKAASIPFHFWHAEADAVAPAPVCILISGIMAPLGLYGLGRVYWSVFAGSFAETGGIWTILLWLGGATALVGAILSTRQRQLKRLLAFSTIGHVGMMLAGMATSVAAGVGGMLVYMFGHGMVKGALFLAVGIVLHRLGSVDEPTLHGKGRDMPWVAALFVAGGLGLAGMPPFATFTGKALMESGAHHTGAPWLPYVFTLASGLTAGAVLRAAASIFLGWGRDPDAEDASPTDHEAPETAPSGNRTPLPMLLAPSVLLILAAVLGLIPRLTSAAREAASRFLDAKAYRALVLHGHPMGQFASFAHAKPYIGIDRQSIILAFAAVAIAVIFVVISLFGHKLPSLLQKAGSLAYLPLAALERLHSGDIRDYVAWLVLGSAGLGVAFTAILAGWV